MCVRGYDILEIVISIKILENLKNISLEIKMKNIMLT